MHLGQYGKNRLSLVILLSSATDKRVIVGDLILQMHMTKEQKIILSLNGLPLTYIDCYKMKFSWENAFYNE